MRRIFLLFTLTLLLQGCYRSQPTPRPNPVAVEVEAENPYVLTLYADARGLDFSSGKALIASMKAQSGGETHGSFGHTWIRLKGLEEDQEVVIEGGHSGELGRVQPEYFDGVMAKMRNRDPNPISYLWCTQWDGFFQRGSGGHIPTHRAVFILDEDEYRSVINYIDPANYNYREYSITNNQCVSFCARVAGQVGEDLAYEATLSVPQKIRMYFFELVLWRDPRYSWITLGLPDVIILNPQFEPIQ